MTQVTVQRTINLPQERVWPILADFPNIYRFHPAIAQSPQIGDKDTGLGAQRRCEFYDGNHVTEQVVGWEEGRSMDVEITEGSMPLNRAEAHVEIEALGPKQTRVSFTMNYEPKFGPLGWMMDKIVLRRNFTKILGQVLEGLETYALTGQRIGQGGKVESPSQRAA